jgi:hypothetical protein
VGVLAETTIDTAALTNTTTYGIYATNDGTTSAKGALGYAYGYNGAEARNGAASTQYAAVGITTGTTISNYGVNGDGHAYAAYFDGSIVINDGDTTTSTERMIFGDPAGTHAYLKEANWKKILQWCGAWCVD